MSDNNFWVNPDGLAKSNAGLGSKATEINNLAATIVGLTSPSVVNAAAGGDAAGKQFATTHLQQADALLQGLQSWASAVGQAGDSLGSTAKLFNTAENNAGDASGSLGNQLNSGSGSGGSGSGSGGSGGPADTAPHVTPGVVMTQGSSSPADTPPDVVMPDPSSGAPGNQLDSGSGSGGSGSGSGGSGGPVGTPPLAAMPGIPLTRESSSGSGAE
jgi:hypothetical protein